MCDIKEIWYIKENGGKGVLVGIASNKSRWFIAEEVQKKHAIMITKFFNKKDIKMYRVRHWVQETNESGSYRLTGLMPYATADILCNQLESANIIIDQQFV
jgi:hypothetical protein